MLPSCGVMLGHTRDVQVKSLQAKLVGTACRHGLVFRRQREAEHGATVCGSEYGCAASHEAGSVLRILAATMLTTLLCSAQAAYTRISTEGNGVFSEPGQYSTTVVALTESSIGEYAIRVTGYSLIGSPASVSITCTDYAYQGELSDSYVFKIEKRSFFVRPADINYALVSGLVNGKTADEKSLAADFVCPALGEPSSSLEGYVPVRVAQLYLTYPSSGFLVTLSRVVGSRISAQFK